MRVAIVNPSDAKGGAARVALTLARGLRARGHEVVYFVENRTLDEPWIVPLPPPSPTATNGLAWRACHRLGLDSLNLTGTFPRCVPAHTWDSFDVIHLHDAPMLNWSRLPWLSRRAPLIWTMHTAAPFTGNCLYPLGCERFTSACGDCPRYGSFPLNWLHRDGSRGVMLIKRLAAASARLRAVIGVSDWIGRLAARSALGRFPLCTIPNPVDTAAFRPRDRAEARARLGLPAGKRIILIGAAADPRDNRKGFDIALAALRALRTPDVMLQPLGIDATPRAESGIEDLRLLPPNHLDSDEMLNLHYAAADLVWHPSRADTSSMVSLESMASGTPVIAADVGGVPEVVGRGDDAGGVLIPPGSPEALARATDDLLASPGRAAALGAAGRRRCEERFCLGRFVDSHEKIYRGPPSPTLS